MSTPNSAAAAYATPADLLSAYDANTVGQLVSDTQQKVDPVSLVTAGTPGNKVLQARLDAAAGLVEAACLRGGMYSPADLAALTGVGKAFLVQLNCDLCLGLLYRRRPNGALPPAPYLEALDRLKQLEDGAAVLGILEAQQAGDASHVVEDRAAVDSRGLTATQLSGTRYFGRRVNRTDGPYQGF